MTNPSSSARRMRFQSILLFLFCLDLAVGFVVAAVVLVNVIVIVVVALVVALVIVLLVLVFVVALRKKELSYFLDHYRQNDIEE